jgi:nucleoside-diphosphate-sugar epimerase
MRTIPLLIKGYKVFALVRNTFHCAKFRKLGVLPLLGDLDDRASLARIAGLADRVLHFAPPRNAISTSSFTNFSQAAVDTRTQNLLSVLSQGTLPRQLIYISTSGVYGDCGGAYVSESSTVNPNTTRGQLRVNAELQIRNWARRNEVNASILRVPGIYAADRLPLERLRSTSPAIIQPEDSYTNHIHADDLARCVAAAMRYGMPNRVYHTSDDSEMKMGDYFDAVADAFNLPRPSRLPRVEVKQSVSPMLWSFMGESRRLRNLRMKRELKVKLSYPTVADTLAAAKPHC